MLPTAQTGLENISASVSYWEISLLVAVLWLAMLWREGLYDLERLASGAGEFLRVLRALGIGVVGFILLTYIVKTPPPIPGVDDTGVRACGCACQVRSAGGPDVAEGVTAGRAYAPSYTHRRR